MSDALPETALKPRHSMTRQMLDWAVSHHEATSETEFPVDNRFRRAAAQHYHGVWGLDRYWIHLSPPSIHAPRTEPFWIVVEVNENV